MKRFSAWMQSMTQRSPRQAAAVSMAFFAATFAAVTYAGQRGGTTALLNPATSNDYLPPWRLFVVLGLLLIGYWLLGLRPRASQVLAALVLGLTISWALRPYEADARNEVAAAMHEQGVYYAHIGDIFVLVAMGLSVVGILVAAALLIAPEPTRRTLEQIAGNASEVMSGSVALPVVTSAFVLAVFSEAAWEAMARTPGANIAGLVLALLLSSAWILDRSTRQPWWLVTIVVVLLFGVLVWMFLLLTSLLVQPETSLSWVDGNEPLGVAVMEGARLKLAATFAAVAVLATINAERPELQGAG